MSHEFFDEGTLNPEDRFVNLVLRQIPDPEYRRARLLIAPIFLLIKNGFPPRTHETDTKTIGELLRAILGRTDTISLYPITSNTAVIPPIKKSFELEYLSPTNNGRRFYEREITEQARIKKIYRLIQDTFRLSDSFNLSPDVRTHAQSTIWVALYSYITSTIVDGAGAAEPIASIITALPHWIPIGDGDQGYVVLINQ